MFAGQVAWPHPDPAFLPCVQYHMRIHKEERKYLCPDCGYKCKWVNQLKYHMTKHTGECCPLGTGHGAPGRALGLCRLQLHASFATSWRWGALEFWDFEVSTGRLRLPSTGDGV